MGICVSKTPRAGVQRGYLQGTARNELHWTKKEEEIFSKATIDGRQIEDKTPSQKTNETNESDNAAEHHLESDEAHDSTSQSVQQKDDTNEGQKRLFECDILPVSSMVLIYNCTECEKDVKCTYSLFSFNSSCMVVAETTCEHLQSICDTIELENNVRFCNKRRVFIEELTGTVFCILSGEIYSLFSTSVKRCLITSVSGKQTLSGKELFTTSDTCMRITTFNHGFASIIKVHGDSGTLLQIQYVDALGKVQRFVYKKPNGDHLLNDPTRLLSNYAGNILYVIDGKTILVLDVNGVLLKSIEFETTPTCLTSDNENNMYVVCDKDLIQLNDQFERRVLLKGDTKSAKIEAITWVNSARGLVVIRGSWINLYKLLP